MASFRFVPPRKGIAQGIIPTRLPPDFASSLMNFRVGNETWNTRKGMDPYRIIPGTGRTRLMATAYFGGARYRLGARGQPGAVKLWDLLEETDTVYQAVLDDDGNPVNALASHPFHCVSLFDAVYITDQEGPLLRYDPLTRLANPVTGLPTPATPPRVIKTMYGLLEDWLPANTPPWGWFESDDTELSLEAVGASDPDFDLDVGGTARLRSDTGPKGEFVSLNPTDPATPLGIDLPTSQIALWIWQTVARNILRFQLGQAKPNEVPVAIDPPQKEVPYVFFLPTSGLQTLNYLRIKNVLNQTEVRNLIMSAFVMPGRLLGPMQYRYTYYRPSTYEESSPSPVGPDAPMVFTEGVNYKNETVDAFQRAALLIPTANPDRLTGDKIRLWRNGGTAELIADGYGEPQWTLLGEIDDFDTTSGALTTAGATTMLVSGSLHFAPETVAGQTTYQWALIDKGEDTEEFLRVLSVAGNTLTFASPTEQDHANGATVQLVYLDNVPNEVLATEITTLDLERDPPPEGAKWLVKTGDGRMLAFNFLEDRDGDGIAEYRREMGMAVSNKPTPLRRRDHEVFPIAPDPYTTHSLTQGFRTDIESDSAGDAIMWAGVFLGRITVITRQHVFLVMDHSQASWNSSSVRKVLDRGCIAPDSVVELNKKLIWASDGPSIISWDGSGGVTDISFERVSGEGETYVGSAPSGYEADDDVLVASDRTAYWESWFARAHAVGSSIYYRLWMIPDDPLVARLTDLLLVSATTVSSATYGFTDADIGLGIEIPEAPTQLGWFPGLYRIESVNEDGVATLSEAIGNFGYGYPYETANAALWLPFCSLRLDYDALNNAWEPVQYNWDRDADGVGDQALGWDTAEVQYGGGDNRGLFAAAWNPSEGDLWEQEVGLLDGEVPIKVDATTYRAPIAQGAVTDFSKTRLYMERVPGECDVLHLTVTMGGGEYAEKSICKSVRLVVNKGTGDTEIPVNFEPETAPKGRWLEMRMQGDWSYRPAIREVTDEPDPVREGRMTAQSP